MLTEGEEEWREGIQEEERRGLPLASSSPSFVVKTTPVVHRWYFEALGSNFLESKVGDSVRSNARYGDMITALVDRGQRELAFNRGPRVLLRREMYRWPSLTEPLARPTQVFGSAVLGLLCTRKKDLLSPVYHSLLLLHLCCLLRLRLADGEGTHISRLRSLPPRSLPEQELLS